MGLFSRVFSQKLDDTVPIPLINWVTSSGKFPERSKSMTPEIEENAQDLLRKVNRLLSSHEVTSVGVSSGFRPESVNKKTPGAVKRSGHVYGKAIDLDDPNGYLKSVILSDQPLLEDLGLFVEHPSGTPTWCHVDCVDRGERKNRIFIP